MTDRMLSPKGRAEKLRVKWLHPGTCWIVDLVKDIEEQIRDALEAQREADVRAVIAWGKDRVQGDRDTSEAIAEMLKAQP